MEAESYDIHNFCSFKLINSLRLGGFLASRNIEYEHFRTGNISKPHFVIRVHDLNRIKENSDFADDEYLIIKDRFSAKNGSGSCMWVIKIRGLDDFVNVIDLYGHVSGLRKLFKYTALKNIFVRSLISLHLIKCGCALVHSSAVSVGEKAFLFVGRPGVFKTSLAMEFIRKYGAEYLGEENSIIRKGIAYPFPLNIKSFEYKLKWFRNEKPRSKQEKLCLIRYVLCDKSRNKVPISKPCKIEGVFFLKSGDRFSIRKAELNKEMLIDLVKNEKLEIGLTPTHMLSSVKKNFFDRYISAYGSVFKESFVGEMWMYLEQIFVDSFSNALLFYVSMPRDFNSSISKDLYGAMVNG